MTGKKTLVHFQGDVCPGKWHYVMLVGVLLLAVFLRFFRLGQAAVNLFLSQAELESLVQDGAVRFFLLTSEGPSGGAPPGVSGQVMPPDPLTEWGT